MAFAGFDIGGTYAKAVLIDDGRNVVARTQAPTRSDGGTGFLTSLLQQLRDELCTQARVAPHHIESCGLGLPGIVDNAAGCAVFAPNIGWKSPVEVRPLVRDAIGLPCALANDAVCAGVAEAQQGSGVGKRRMLLLTLGTGVGVSLTVDGVPFEDWGTYGGEMGHIPIAHGSVPCSCGTPGCFQQCASAVALGYLAADAVHKHPESTLRALCEGEGAFPSARDVFEAAEAGDAAASEALDLHCSYLCEGIGGLVNIFRPDLVVIGGGLASAHPRIVDDVARRLPAHVYASHITGCPPVVAAQCGSYAGGVGAALLAPERALRP